MAMKVAIDAVQIFGGPGTSRVPRWNGSLRDAKAVQIFDGSNQIQRMVVSKNIILD